MPPTDVVFDQARAPQAATVRRVARVRCWGSPLSALRLKANDTWLDSRHFGCGCKGRGFNPDFWPLFPFWWPESKVLS